MALRSRFRLEGPLDLLATWGTLRRGPRDPAWAWRSGVLWRGVRMGEQALTLAVRAEPDGAVLANAWGEPQASRLLLDRLPAMLGEGDDPAGFEPRHPVLARAMGTRPGWRMPRTGMVLESLLPSIVEQKVTGAEALSAWQRLVRRHGDRAPGPAGEGGLMVPPSVSVLQSLPSWEWLRLGVSPERADTIARVLPLADRLEQAAGLTAAEARQRLTSVPGVGVWTAAETAQRALGDADAISFGDYHVAADIGWALTGAVTDDAGLVELLAPYRGHRYRVQRLLELAGLHRPRRGPRMAPRSHLPVRR